MTEPESEELVSRLQDSFPRHLLSTRERSSYRELFQRFETRVVSLAIQMHLELSTSPVFSEVRSLILNRTSPRSDYQRQSRLDKAAFEREERDKAEFFSSLSPDEREKRCKEVLETHPWLARDLKGRDPVRSTFVANLIYAKSQNMKQAAHR